MRKKITAVAAAALLHSVSAGAEVQAYGHLGFSDSGYGDDGLAIKLGADFSPNLGGNKGLGLTAFYAHTDADDVPNGRNWSYETDTFAFGPTFTYPFPGSKWAFQARGFLELNRVTWRDSCCSYSDTDIDLGIGLGMHYALNGKTAIRLDFDLLGNSVDVLSIGLGLKF